VGAGFAGDACFGVFFFGAAFIAGTATLLSTVPEILAASSPSAFDPEAAVAPLACAGSVPPPPAAFPTPKAAITATARTPI